MESSTRWTQQLQVYKAKKKTHLSGSPCFVGRKSNGHSGCGFPAHELTLNDEATLFFAFISVAASDCTSCSSDWQLSQRRNGGRPNDMWCCRQQKKKKNNNPLFGKTSYELNTNPKKLKSWSFGFLLSWNKNGAGITGTPGACMHVDPLCHWSVLCHSSSYFTLKHLQHTSGFFWMFFLERKAKRKKYLSQWSFWESDFSPFRYDWERIFWAQRAVCDAEFDPSCGLLGPNLQQSRITLHPRHLRLHLHVAKSTHSKILLCWIVHDFDASPWSLVLLWIWHTIRL